MSLATAISYAQGQCTWEVARLLNWVPAGWGNADTWLANAIKQGFPVSSVPVLGSVMVLQPGQGGAGSDGHVAVVSGIAGNGLPIVTEMNWNGGAGIQDTRTLTASQAAAVAGYILPQGSSVPSGSATNAATFAALGGGNQATLTSSNWYDNIPVIGGVINSASIIGWFFDKVSDPATYLTLAWLGVAAFLMVSGLHLLTGFGKSAGEIVAALPMAAAA